ncbi:hypothetical protein RUND412_006783 [Rhizina undulata]
MSSAFPVDVEDQYFDARVSPLPKDEPDIPLIEGLIVWINCIKSTFDAARTEIPDFGKLLSTPRHLGKTKSYSYSSRNLPLEKPTHGRLEYYLMAPMGQENIAGLQKYEVCKLSLDRPSEMYLDPQTFSALTENQVIAIHNMIHERNANNTESGEWILSAINPTCNSGQIGVVLSLHKDEQTTFQKNKSLKNSGGENESVGENIEKIEKEWPKFSDGKGKQSATAGILEQLPSTSHINPENSDSDWLMTDSDDSSVCSWGSAEFVSGASMISPQGLGQGVHRKSRHSVLHRRSGPRTQRNKEGNKI